MDRRLLEYLPSFMKEIKEVQAIMEVEQDEIQQLCKGVREVIDNQFVATSSKVGIDRWEKILALKVKGTEDLETRKFRILTRLNEQLPYTFRVLDQQLNSLCGKGNYSVKLDDKSYLLWVQIDLSAKNNLEDIRFLTKRITPANMIIHISLIYNKHKDYIKYAHKELKKLTHDQIRNNVLEETRICNRNKDLMDCIHEKLSNYTQMQIRNEDKINVSRNNKL